MGSIHVSNKPKGFLFSECLTSVLSIIRDTRFMSDMAVRYAPAFSIPPRVFLLIVAYILFVVAKSMSGHIRATLNYTSVIAFLAAVWQSVLTKIVKDAFA